MTPATITTTELAVLRGYPAPSKRQRDSAADWARRHGIPQTGRTVAGQMLWDRKKALAEHEAYPPGTRLAPPNPNPPGEWCRGRHGGPHRMTGDNVMNDGRCRVCATTRRQETKKQPEVREGERYGNEHG